MHTYSFSASRRSALATLAAGLGWLGAPAFGQSGDPWPSKPVRIIVGAPAGGPVDIMARSVSDLMARSLGQPFVVDNKPGALGQLGVEALLAAPRDGTTLMIAFNGLVSEIPHSLKLKYDPFKDIVPLAPLAGAPLVLVANPALGVGSLKELVAYVKAHPGKVSFASYSAGTLSHVLGLQLNRSAGLDMQHVGYRGGPPALQDVMAGQVQCMFDSVPSALQAIRAGKLRALAVTTPTRSGVLPDVPSMAELGHPEMSAYPWMAVWSAGGMAPALQARVRAEALKAVRDPSIGQRFSPMGMEIDARPPGIDELALTLRKENAMVGELLRSINYRPE